MWNDVHVLKIIDDFLPNCIFDAHMHISHLAYNSGPTNAAVLGLHEYLESIIKIMGNRSISCNMIPYPEAALKSPDVLLDSCKFVAEQLDIAPGNVGEIIVMPNDTVDDIERRLIHKQILGLKCYWTYTKSSAFDQSNVEDYLPESAWEVANKNNMFITLHLVKDDALADRENLEYIKKMANRYKNAKLILAHCARAFANWTVFDTVDELVAYDNVFFDFSGISDAIPMTYILKKCGVKRCMWGSDFPISDLVGKPITIANRFYWLLEDEINQINAKNTIKPWTVGVENIMSVYQSAKLLSLSSGDVEDFFYNNAKVILK